MFTVKKIHLGQWRWDDGRNTWHLPPGFAVCKDGIPIVWQDGKKSFTLEVFDLKSAAEKEAAHFNEHGFEKARILVQFG